MELKLLPLMLAQNAVAKLIDVGVVVLSLALYAGGRMELLNCVMLSSVPSCSPKGWSRPARSRACCGW